MDVGGFLKDPPLAASVCVAAVDFFHDFKSLERCSMSTSELRFSCDTAPGISGPVLV